MFSFIDYLRSCFPGKQQYEYTIKDKETVKIDDIVFDTENALSSKKNDMNLNSSVWKFGSEMKISCSGEHPKTNIDFVEEKSPSGSTEDINKEIIEKIEVSLTKRNPSQKNSQTSENIISAFADKNIGKLNGSVKDSIHLNIGNNTLALISTKNGDLSVSSNEVYEMFKIDRKGSSLYSNKNIIDLCERNINEIITDEEINYAKKLLLTDVEGSLLNKGSLLINAAGLEDGLRNKRDGLTYFGVENKENISHDFILNIDSRKLKTSTCFIIFYSRESDKYFIRNYSTDKSKNYHFLYYQLNESVSIRDYSLFLIGDVFLNIFHDKATNELKITSYVGQETSTQVFSHKEKAVTLGRQKCSINYKSSLLSKTHCTIAFDQSQGEWKLFDGDGKRKSTNGVWVLIESKHEISSNTFIKFMNTSFKIEVL